MGSLTKIDRLGLSLAGGFGEVQDLLSGAFRHLGEPAYEYGSGGLGFKHSALARLGGAQVAWLGWGGTSQKGRSFVDVSGLGCTLVDDWQALQGSISELPGVKATRIDIAADFYRGEVTYEQTMEAYHEGRFRTRRQPDHTQILSTTGRTVYIGKRGNDVMLRAYEKGRKEFAGLPAEARLRGIGAVLGRDDAGEVFPLDQWFRLELELRAKTRPLSLDVITERDQYFAGAYPFLQDMLPGVEPEVLVRPEHIVEATVELSLARMREQWGNTLFTALTYHGGDVFAVWKRICGEQHSERLVSAGALLFKDYPSHYEVAEAAGSQARH